MHDFSLFDFSPLVIIDGRMEAVSVEKRVDIAARERLKLRDKPPLMEIDGLVLKRPITRIFEKEVYLSGSKLKDAENQRVVAIGRPHEDRFHLYNYIIPETGSSFANRALTPGAQVRQIVLMAVALLIALGVAFFSIGFFQRSIFMGLIWLTAAVVFLSVAKHFWEQYKADRMLAAYVERGSSESR